MQKNERNKEKNGKLKNQEKTKEKAAKRWGKSTMKEKKWKLKTIFRCVLCSSSYALFFYTFSRFLLLL